MRTSTTTSAIADSVSALLKQAREESGLSRSAVALRSKIPERYIALFEDDTNSAMPDDVYVKIYLKAYGKFLGFEANTLLDLYKKEKARFAPPAETTGTRRTRTASRSTSQRRHPTKSVPESALYVTPKLIQNAFLALTLIGFAAYFGLQIKKLISPPEVTLLSPVDGLVTEDRSLIVEGRTESEVTVRINGKQVSPDADGKFRDSLDLKEGLNLITITGSKKHSKNMTVTRRVIVTEKERPVVAAPTEGTVQEETDESLKAAAEAAKAPVVAETPKPIVKPAPTPTPIVTDEDAGTVAGATDTAPVAEQTTTPAAPAAETTAQPVEATAPAPDPSAVETAPAAQTQPEPEIIF